MCSVSETVNLPSGKPKFKSGQRCMKCDQSAVCIARTKDPFCSDCFLNYFMHRFRATLGKTKSIKHGEKIFLAYSGGINSTAMLQVVQEGLADATKKKLRFTPSVIIIDDGVVHYHSNDERVRLLAERILISLKMGFPTFFTRLESIYSSCQIIDVAELLSVQPTSRQTQTDKDGHHSDGLGIVHRDNRSKITAATPEGENPVILGNSTGHDDTDTPEGENPVILGNSTGHDDNNAPEGKNSVILGNSTGHDDTDAPEGENPVILGNSTGHDDTDAPEGENPDNYTSHGDTSLLASGFADEDFVKQKKKKDTSLKEKPPQLKEELNVSLDDVIKMVSALMGDDPAETRLKGLFSSLATLTARENMLVTLRNQLLTAVAEKCNFSKIMLASNETNLAVDLLSGVAEGRGGTVPLDIGFADERCEGVTIIRPMREFPASEVAFYCNLLKLPLVVYATQSSKAPKTASIGRMTESFVQDLLVDFPNTVNTIFRTGDKMSLSGNLSTTSVCLLCKVPLSSSRSSSVVQNLKRSMALQSKQTSSSCHSPSTDSSCQCKSADDEGCCREKSTQRLSLEEIQNGLCYGCRLIVHDMGQDGTSSDIFPPYVTRQATKQMQRNEMKDKIKDFLLIDGSDTEL